MELLKQEDVLKLKLRVCIKRPQLDTLVVGFGLSKKGNANSLIERLVEVRPDEEYIDQFIRKEYAQQVDERRKIWSDEFIKNELDIVCSYSWASMPGSMENLHSVMHKTPNFSEMLEKTRPIHDADDIAESFNYWTTLLIENHAGIHRRVVPTIKNIPKVDIFFDGQPFDIKIGTLPRNYDIKSALENPQGLARWMYENQGERRFGAENRLFIVLLDKENPKLSKYLQRDFNLVYNAIDKFFDTEKVSVEDTIDFTFKGTEYSTISKVLLITK